eukprot:g51778.t1
MALPFSPPGCNVPFSPTSNVETKAESSAMGKQHLEELVEEDERACFPSTRWRALAAGMYLQFLAGLIYAFPLYSAELKTLLNTTQAGLSLIATMGAVGGEAVILCGVFYDWAGPRKTSHVGALLASLGFLGAYLVTNHTLDWGVWGVAGCYCLACQGLTWMDNSAMGATISNFPKDKGMAAGLVKTQLGLSASAIILISSVLFPESQGSSSKTAVLCSGENYVPANSEVAVGVTLAAAPADTTHNSIQLLLFFAVLCGVAGTLASLFLHVKPLKHFGTRLNTTHRRRVLIAYACVVVLMAYLAVVSSLNLIWQRRGVSYHHVETCFAIVVIVLYLFPLGFAWPVVDDESIADPTPLLMDEAGSPQRDEDNVTPVRKRNKQSAASPPPASHHHSLHNFTYGQALCSVEFWCLILIFLGGSGPAFMTVAQLTQINAALGGSSAEKGVLVVLFGISNSAGRLLSGLWQDKLSDKGLSRPLLCLFSLLTMSAGQLCMSWAGRAAWLLWLGVSLTGLAFGAVWCIIGPLTSDVVGHTAFGKVYSTVVMSSMVSAALFNQGIAAPLYDRRYELQPPNPDKACCGQLCFQQAHLIASLLPFVMCLAPFLLHFRSKRWYDLHRAG